MFKFRNASFEKKIKTTTHFPLTSTGAEGRNGYLEVMTKMADKYKKKMWG